MAYIPSSDSVVGFQSKPSSLLVGASIIGLTPVNVTNLSISPSVIAYQAAGSVLAVSGSFSGGNSSVTLQPSNNVIGSVAVLQGTNPWVVGNSSITLVGGGTVYLEKNAVTPSALGIPILFKIDETNSVLSAVSPQSPLPIRGSVAVLQGTNPWTVSNPSVVVNNIVTGQSSVYLIPGVGVLGSVAVLQGTSPWLVTGSVAVLEPGGVRITSLVSTVPSSVVVGASIQGTVPVTQTTSPWVVNVPTPSYFMYQAAGSILAVSGSFSSGNSSVNLLGGGTVYQEKDATIASALGIPMLFKNNMTTSTLSTVSTTNPLPIIGSVATLQGTNPWVVSNTSITVNNIVTGQSSVYLIPGVGVLGSVATLQGTNPWLVNEVGSVLAALKSTAASVIVVGNYLEKSSAGNASVLGFPILFKNNVTTSTLATVSTTDPLPIVGSVANLQGTNPWIVQAISSLLVIQTTSTNVSVVGASVTTLQGTNPWVISTNTPSYLSIQPGGSVINANISGSVAARLFATSVSALQGTEPWVIGSIVGTFAEDSAHTTADKGIFTLNVRNDTMSSVTSTDGDYSPLSTGPVGEGIVANSPITKWVVGRGSVMTGTSIQLLAGPGTSIFTYISGIHLTNEASIATRVTITQGLGAVPASMLTWFVVPAGGGSNAIYMNPIRVLDNLGISASINAVASVYVTITGFTAKT